MIKKLSIGLVTAVAATAFLGCNSDSSSYYSEVIYSSTQVQSFKLKANNDILSGLDSVFFSIDLNNAKIFNADSLPYGTDVSRMVLLITTDACSTIDLKVPLANGNDTVINYITNSTDSIDFTHGPVTLHLVSYDGTAERDYTINVNVHKMEPDSLYWNKLAKRSLPTGITSPSAQKTVKLGDEALCLTTNGSAYNIASTADPASNNWTIEEVSFPFTPEVNSLAGGTSTLYILSNDGALYTSTDAGSSWTATGETWHYIYGCHEDMALGVKSTDAGFVRVTYPATEETAAPGDFPVEDTGNLAVLSTEWSPATQSVMVGGRHSDGVLSQSVWGYDGKQWQRISRQFPMPIAGASVVNYRVATVDTLSWRVTEYPALMVLGGELESGMNGKTYISRNSGLNWKEGDELLTLPDYIAPRTEAQPLVFDTTMEARSASDEWVDYPSAPLSRWWSVCDSPIWSRATAPITEWDVPYIYLFGGYDANGLLFNSVWKGVINRLSFKPII